MSVAPSKWQTNLYAIIQHPSEPSILLLSDNDGWRLPCVQLEKRVWTQEVEAVNLGIRQKFGLNSIVLRCAWTQLNREAHQLSALYILEPADRSWTPPADSRWIGREVAGELALVVPEQRSALLDYLADSGSDLRSPWAQPGWFGSAERWMREQLTQRGYQLIAPIEQVKSGGISCVLRSRTTTGDIYFKVASRPALFGDEPAIMAALAVEHPKDIPAPLAIEPEQGWMLLADVGPDLRQSAEIETWKTALRLHSRIQQSFAGRAENVLAIGCLDRRLDRLALQIDALLIDSVVLNGLTDEELQQVQALRPRIQQMCRDLASYNVPETLVHGDLHGGNVALRDDRYLFFDWTDGCLAHPFFDLVTMLVDAERFLPGEALPELRDAYLEQWTNYAPIDRLQELWRLAEPLGSLHQVVTYYYIVESLEPASKHEQGNGGGYWIRWALKSLSD